MDVAQRKRKPRTIRMNGWAYQSISGNRWNIDIARTESKKLKAICPKPNDDYAVTITVTRKP